MSGADDTFERDMARSNQAYALAGAQAAYTTCKQV